MAVTLIFQVLLDETREYSSVTIKQATAYVVSLLLGKSWNFSALFT